MSHTVSDAGNLNTVNSALARPLLNAVRSDNQEAIISRSKRIHEIYIYVYIPIAVEVNDAVC